MKREKKTKRFHTDWFDQGLELLNWIGRLRTLYFLFRLLLQLFRKLWKSFSVKHIQIQRLEPSLLISDGGPPLTPITCLHYTNSLDRNVEGVVALPRSLWKDAVGGFKGIPQLFDLYRKELIRVYMWKSMDKL